MNSSPSAASPLLSIIIPHYNHAESLACTLASLQRQTWRNMQILVVDDASEKSCAAVVADFQAQGLPVTLIQLPHRSFTFQARLRGLMEAKGDYLAFVDADDRFHSPSVLEDILRTSIATGADITHFYTVTQDEHGVDWLRRPALPFADRLEGRQIFATWVKEECPAHSVWCKIYSRDLYEKVRSMPHEHCLYYHEDFYLTAHFLFWAKLYVRSQVVGYTYVPPGNYDLTRLLKCTSDDHVLLRLMPRRLRSWGAEEELVERFMEYMLRMFVLSAGRMARELASTFGPRLRMSTEALVRATEFSSARSICEAMMMANAINSRKINKILSSYQVPHDSVS